MASAPDFVGLGVQKAGTTWWYDALAAHRCIHHAVGRPKELHFFDRFWGQPFGARDVSTYHRWFARPPGHLAGEWTPRYLHDWWAPALVAEAAPSARFLVLLRDPVDRYLSGVAHELRSRGRRDPAIPGDALRRSCYADQLERLLTVVPAERVVVQQFESCVARPGPERDRVWAAIGLEPDRSAPIPPAQNVTSGERPHLPAAVAAQVDAELSRDLERLLAMPFELDPAWWPSAVRLLGGRSATSR